jgi:hypothetical protein
MQIERLPITIAANENKPFVKAGRYIEVLDSLYPVSIQFYDDQGGMVGTALGVDSGFFASVAFSSFVLTSVNAQTVTLLITDGSGGSRRQPGIVQVVDSDKSTTDAGAAFMGVNSSGVPGAGQFGTVQLWNPVGSGKKAIIERVYVDVATATQVCLGLKNAAVGVPSIAMASKLAGGAASTCVTYTYGANASDPAGLLAATQWNPGVAAGVEAIFTPKRPFVLMPGYGLLIGARTAAIALVATFEFWEQTL